MINTQKTSLYFLVLIIMSLAIAPAFALGEGNRNLLLIGVMGLSPILIIVFNRYHRTDIWLLVFMASIILIPLIHQPQRMRWSTIIYSCMFALTFMAYSRLFFKSKLSILTYVKILKFLIFAYCITLIIQQICVLLGLPIFNISNYDVSTPWKLNSLSAEPSHSARIVALLMYSYIVIKELIINRTYSLKKDFKHDKWVWLAFLWIMITMGSGTAFLFLPLVLLKFLKAKNILPLAIISVAVFALMTILGVDTFERTFKVIKATITLDIDSILRADHSAALRIVPFLVLIPMLNITTINGLLGHGIDYVGTFLSDYIYGIEKGASGGGTLLLWMEYGFIIFIIYIALTLKSIYIKRNFINLIFWFLLVFLNVINSQMVWLCLIILFTNNFFESKLNNYKSLIEQNE